MQARIAPRVPVRSQHTAPTCARWGSLPAPSGRVTCSVLPAKHTRTTFVDLDGQPALEIHNQNQEGSPGWTPEGGWDCDLHTRTLAWPAGAVASWP